MEWIDCKEKLPEVGTEVNVVTETTRGLKVTSLSLYFNANGYYYWDNNYGQGNTHLFEVVKMWQPLPSLPNPPKLIWQSSTMQQPDVWTDRTDEEYELMNHLARFNWQQIEK